MAFIRHYVMRSAPENADILGQLLAKLRALVAAMPGSLRVDLMRATAEPGCFFFIEHWGSKADQIAAGSALPPGIMASLKPLLIAPPAGSDLSDEI